MTEKTSTYNIRHIGKVEIDATTHIQRVIKIEKRTNKITGEVLIALVQSTRVNSDGLPYQEPTRVRDILVCSVNAFQNLLQLSSSQDTWKKILEEN